MRDTIYRDEVVEVVKKWFEKIRLNPDTLIDGIVSLPSADRLQGEWLIGNRPLEGKFRLYRCSVCGYEPFYKGEPITPTNMTLLYCPNCGARMFAKDINVPSKKGVGNDI